MSSARLQDVTAALRQHALEKAVHAPARDLFWLIGPLGHGTLLVEMARRTQKSAPTRVSPEGRVRVPYYTLFGLACQIVGHAETVWRRSQPVWSRVAQGLLARSVAGPSPSPPSAPGRGCSREVWGMIGKADHAPNPSIDSPSPVRGRGGGALHRAPNGDGRSTSSGTVGSEQPGARGDCLETLPKWLSAAGSPVLASPIPGPFPLRLRRRGKGSRLSPSLAEWDRGRGGETRIPAVMTTL